MPSLHRATWLLPIVSPPVRDGWILVHRGHIVGCGGPHDRVPSSDGPAGESLGDIHEINSDEPMAVLPGLVNAHTHLELSWMRGRIAPVASMPAWVARLLASRRAAGMEPVEPIHDAVREMRATGTVLAGDVTNTLAAWDAIADSHLSAMVFLELIGFNTPDPQALVSAAEMRLAALTPLAWMRSAIVPHAPYSVSPPLMQAIAAAGGDGPLSVHVGESPEEVEFLQRGTGAWRNLLEDLGVWTDAWTPPECGPVEYLDRLGLVDDRLLAVHGVQLADSELARLAAAGATVVTCPRSNRWVGVGSPPIDRFYASGVRVAVGTDSLASVGDLNMFAELAVVKQLAQEVEASRILRSATLDGAMALGFGRECGSIEAGKRADLIGVRVPSAIEDVEEYLLSGLTAEDIRWLDPD